MNRKASGIISLARLMFIAAMALCFTYSFGQGETVTSSGYEMKQRLVETLNAKLSEKNLKLDDQAGYNWLILVQTSDYGAKANERFTDLRRGVQYFIDHLRESRKDWNTEKVKDTISIFPYHFNLMDKDNSARWKIPLKEHISDPQSLVNLIPGQPIPDTYEPNSNTLYFDGHDWRRALTQALREAKLRNITSNLIVIVIDWNNLSQAPQRPVDPSMKKKPVDNKYLVDENVNPEGWQEYINAISEMKLEKGDLVTVKAGKFEYDLGIFPQSDLVPMISDVVTDIDDGNGDGSGVATTLLVLVLIIALSALAYFAFRPVGVRIDGKSFYLKLVGNTRISVNGPGGKEGPFDIALIEQRAGGLPSRTLAEVQLSFPNKIKVVRGFCTVKGGPGCDLTSGDYSVRIQSSPATVQLLPPPQTSAQSVTLKIELL